MYICRFSSKTVLLLAFGGAGLLMITGYIFVSALCGALVRDYTPEHDAAYYAQNIDALQAELEQAVFPYVEGIESCEPADNKLVIGIRSSKFIETRAVIIDLFDRELFLFEQR